MKLTQTYIVIFTTNNPITGELSDADSTPEAFVYKNGEPSYDISLTVSQPSNDPSGGAGDAGIYKIIADDTWGNSSFIVDDKVDIYIFAVLNGANNHAIIDSFILNNDLAIENNIDSIKSQTDQMEFDNINPSGANPIISTLSPTALDNVEVNLASTGLDNISTTEPSGRATTFREMIVQLFMRFFNKATKSTTTITTYDESGNSVTSQSYTSSGGTDTVNKA